MDNLESLHRDLIREREAYRSASLTVSEISASIRELQVDIATLEFGYAQGVRYALKNMRGEVREFVLFDSFIVNLLGARAVVFQIKKDGSAFARSMDVDPALLAVIE